MESKRPGGMQHLSPWQIRVLGTGAVVAAVIVACVLVFDLGPNRDQFTPSDIFAPALDTAGKMDLTTPKPRFESLTAYTVRTGDTVAAIARDRLGDLRRAREIFDVNPGLEARSLRVGQMIRLPEHESSSLNIPPLSPGIQEVPLPARPFSPLQRED